MTEQLNNLNNEVNPKKRSKNKTTAIIAITAGAVLLIVAYLFAYFTLLAGREVKDITNLPEQVVLFYREQFQLEPVAVPDRSGVEITYSINDTQYATIDENGLITANSIQGSAIVTVKADSFTKTVLLDIYAPIDSEALEKAYLDARNLLDIVNSDTSINQNDVAEAKNSMQQTFDTLRSKGINIEDISEQAISVLASLENAEAVTAKTNQLLNAYELAWDIVEQNQAAAAKAANSAKTKKKTTQKTQKSTAANASHNTFCSVCGSTSHTKHPTCVVCGSTSHSKHPVCPICASTTHTKHPQ